MIKSFHKTVMHSQSIVLYDLSPGVSEMLNNIHMVSAARRAGVEVRWHQLIWCRRPYRRYIGLFFGGNVKMAGYIRVSCSVFSGPPSLSL